MNFRKSSYFWIGLFSQAILLFVPSAFICNKSVDSLYAEQPLALPGMIIMKGPIDQVINEMLSVY